MKKSRLWHNKGLMQVIDLSPPLFTGMPVYPGDPEVVIDQIHSFAKEGWRLRMLHVPSHIGAHVDAFAHMDQGGSTLDQIPLTRFFGQTQVVKVGDKYPSAIGLMFIEGKISLKDVKQIVKVKPNFVAIGDECDFPVEVERGLLIQGVVTITDLINTELLPKNSVFTLYALPLNIKDGDGSPVRAVAMVEEV